ncbi:hypothetical protein SLEP1_g57054 [Rubroshorea leprosula]|uniref:Uncharacterized protein n=1 Tax=Rubroshorea leprosula TaxID=152421 RepID=A0AAV5MKJ2_9ROSI|nr:hypothetical protein SLEP1_g57054 [Rubroshorea leprosula]
MPLSSAPTNPLQLELVSTKPDLNCGAHSGITSIAAPSFHVDYGVIASCQTYGMITCSQVGI